jgi:ATP-dependent DNA helicase RecQ
MIEYLKTPLCRMKFLQDQLDDPTSRECGRCDNCTGERVSVEVSETAAGAARERLLRPGLDVAPRKMWPTGMAAIGVPLSGKIPPAEVAATGRALGRLTDIGWGNRLREILAEGAPDTDIPDEMFDAVVKVLSAWDWAERPTGVVTIGSRTRPRLIGGLGRRIAEIGRLSYLGEFVPLGEPVPRRHNSAQRLRSVWHSLALPGDVAAAASGPVLLVDDRIETGWTMTVATRQLRQAGVPAVLPLVLAVIN